MGVYMLRSYCEQAELYRTISLPPHPSGSPRLVVFDAPGALRSFLRPTRRGLLYDFHQQQTRVRTMVRAFKAAGYELVVFIDCAIPEDKLTTWYRRRAVDGNTVRKLNERLSAVPRPTSIPDGLWLPPNYCLARLCDAFEEAGCRVFNSFADSDADAAAWAAQHHAYAVITDDTDFLCYPGVERLWSTNVKLPSARSPRLIRVSELSRTSLLDSLGLVQTQLQQLAGLLGNDHIKHISRDRVAALREAHPGAHPVALLAREVLALQPSLEAAGLPDCAVHPAVQRLVGAALAAVMQRPPPRVGPRLPATPPAGQEGAAAVDPAVRDTVAAAFAAVLAAARAEARHAAAADDGDDDDNNDDNDNPDEDDDEDDDDDDEDAVAAAASGAAALEGGAAAAAAAAAGSGGLADEADEEMQEMALERCQKAVVQYSGVREALLPPAMVGSGMRVLLLRTGELLLSVGVEDMSRTPAHELLLPLRLSVYASLGLTRVTERLCMPDGCWRDWAAGREVEVPPPLPPVRKVSARRERRGRAGGGGGGIDPAVRALVAAAIAAVGGSSTTTGSAEAAAAAAPAAAAAAEDVHPAVRRLVAAAIASVLCSTGAAYDPLPKTLPQKPTELTALLLARLRALDPGRVEMSAAHEAALALQVSHRASVLAALRSGGGGGGGPVSVVRLPDLHAANLFQYAYGLLSIAVDGRLPRITSLLHVEAFHTLAQRPELAKRIARGPSDAEAAKDAARQAPGRGLLASSGIMGGHHAPQHQHSRGSHRGGGGGHGGPGLLFSRAVPGAGLVGHGLRPGPGAAAAGRTWKGPGAAAGGAAGSNGMGVGGRNGRAGGGLLGGAGGNSGSSSSRGAGGGGARSQHHREGYQPYMAPGVGLAAAVAGGGGGLQGSSSGMRQQLQHSEPLTWQQRQQHAAPHHHQQQQQQPPYQQQQQQHGHSSAGVGGGGGRGAHYHQQHGSYQAGGRPGGRGGGGHGGTDHGYEQRQQQHHQQQQQQQGGHGGYYGSGSYAGSNGYNGSVYGQAQQQPQGGGGYGGGGRGGGAGGGGGYSSRQQGGVNDTRGDVSSHRQGGGYGYGGDARGSGGRQVHQGEQPGGYGPGHSQQGGYSMQVGTGYVQQQQQQPYAPMQQQHGYHHHHQHQQQQQQGYQQYGYQQQQHYAPQAAGRGIMPPQVPMQQQQQHAPANAQLTWQQQQLFGGGGGGGGARSRRRGGGDGAF